LNDKRTDAPEWAGEQTLPGGNRLRRIVPAFVGWILLAGFILLPTTLAYDYSGMDMPTFVYFGDAILQGEALYRDVWDVVGPGIFLAYALGIFVLGKSFVAMHLFDTLWQVTTAIILAGVAARLAKTSVAGLIAGLVYLGCYYSHNYWNWGEPDGLITLPLGLALYFLLRAWEDDRKIHWAAAAFFIGIAILFKITFGLLGIVCLIVAARMSKRNWDVVFMRWLMLAIGVLLPTGAVALYLLGMGGLRDFLIAQFVVAVQYAEVNRINVTSECIFRVLRNKANFPLYLAGLAWAVVRLYGMVRGQSPRWIEFVLAAWLGICAFTLVMHGAYFQYHMIPFAPPVAILMSMAVSDFLAAWKGQNAARRLILTAAALIFAAIPANAWVLRARNAMEMVQGRVAEDEMRHLGAYIRANSQPSDEMTMWGGDVCLYLHADRRSATRFPSSYLVHSDWDNADLKSKFLADFQARKPRYFVLQTAERTGPCFNWYPPPSIALQKFAALQSFLGEEYERVRQGEEYILFRRKEPQANP
jgi:hypothetical protein